MSRAEGASANTKVVSRVAPTTWICTFRGRNVFELLLSVMVVKHLPPTVKYLLTLRKPGLPLAPSFTKLHPVLKSTFEDAQRKKATTGWLTLAVCRLLLIPLSLINMPALSLDRLARC